LGLGYDRGEGGWNPFVIHHSCLMRKCSAGSMRHIGSNWFTGSVLIYSIIKWTKNSLVHTYNSNVTRRRLWASWLYARGHHLMLAELVKFGITCISLTSNLLRLDSPSYMITAPA